MLTNASGLPITTGVSGLGTGVATALAVNTGSAGAPVLFNGALGTPSSGTVTNLTGTASININGTVGATTPTTGAFTTLSASSSVTLSGGTANGVTYLNGSKVLTSGSALTFDGTTLKNTRTSSSSTVDMFASFNDASKTISTGVWGSATSNVGILGANTGYVYTDGDHLSLISGAATGYMAFAVGGLNESMRLTSTGLGIGTSSPSSYDINGSAQLVAANTAGNGTISIVSSTTGIGYLGFADGTTGNEKYRGLLAYDHSTDSLSIRTAGSIVSTLDASGNLGLGVTPSAWGSVIRALQVNNTGMSLFTYTAAGTADQYAFLSNNSYQNSSYADTYVRTNPAAQYRQLNATHAWFNAPSGTAGNAISFTQAMTLDASGNLLLGTTSSVGSERLNVTQSSGNHNARIINSGSSGNIYGPLFNFSAQAPNNTVSLFLVCSDNSATRAQFYSNGGLANYSANNVNLSDRREKTNFAPATSYLDKICAIPVQTFNYLDQNLEEDDGLTLGVVAQDVQAIAPELVTETNWGTVEEPKMRLSIYQTDLQYALMKALQELKTEFDAYKASHP